LGVEFAVAVAAGAESCSVFVSVVVSALDAGPVLVGAAAVTPLVEVVDLGPHFGDVAAVVVAGGGEQSGGLGCGSGEPAGAVAEVGDDAGGVDQYSSDPAAECGEHDIVGQ
jgi:hypothetical protein